MEAYICPECGDEFHSASALSEHQKRCRRSALRPPEACDHIWHAEPDRHCAKGCGATDARGQPMSTQIAVPRGNAPCRTCSGAGEIWHQDVTFGPGPIRRAQSKWMPCPTCRPPITTGSEAGENNR